jgi:hypothetical protein
MATRRLILAVTLVLSGCGIGFLFATSQLMEPQVPGTMNSGR